MMLLYVQSGTVMVRPKAHYVDRPLAISIFSNVAPFEKSLDTPELHREGVLCLRTSGERGHVVVGVSDGDGD